MNLPRLEDCSRDPFLMSCWSADEKGFFKKKKSANTRFLDRRRVLRAQEMLLEHLSPSSELPIADIACGTGNFGLLMKEKGYAVDFVDNEPKFFDYLRLKGADSGRVRFIQNDVSKEGDRLGPYAAIFFGEAIEHMAKPFEVLTRLRSFLATGGLLCLTTPNGDYVDCKEPSWDEVKEQTERNARLANNIGNHVCEFRKKELVQLVREAGFGPLGFELVNSRQVSKKHLFRLLPEKWVGNLDRIWSKKEKSDGKTFGRVQIIVAQRFH